MFSTIRISQFVTTLSVCIGLFVMSGTIAYGATLEFSPSSGSYKAGETFSVKLIVDTGGEQANAAQATVFFDKNLVSVKSVSKDGSVFTLWTTEPTISSTKGTVELGGGSPSGFTGQKTIATIIFKAEKEGTANVSVTAGSIVSPPTFADILSEKKTASFTITAGAVTPKPDPTPTTTRPPALGPSPVAPIITSDTFVDPEAWYATTTGTFKWIKPFDVDEVRVLVDTNEASVPSKARGAISEITFDENDLKEGTSYMHVMFRNATGLGAPTHRKILIDVTPPKAFSVSAVQNDPNSQDVTLTFATEDELSGIARYEIFVDGTSAKSLTKDELINGAYVLSGTNAGERTFTIVAYDNAGNTAKAETSLAVTEAVVATPSIVEEEVVEDTGIDWAFWFILLLVGVVSFLIGAIVYERKAVKSEKEYIKREADEARIKLSGVFGVLRDEIEEQVIALSTKPNMTESERGILQKLKEALEISEELLDKEIEDVQKLL